LKCSPDSAESWAIHMIEMSVVETNRETVSKTMLDARSSNMDIGSSKIRHFGDVSSAAAILTRWS